MRKFQIPKKFILYAKPIVVEDDPSLFMNESCWGVADYKRGKIILQSMNNTLDMCIESYEQSFFHELVHHILYEAGDDDFDPALDKREELVERISKLLHQFFVTSEF